MRITIQLMGQARLAAGCEQVTVDVGPEYTASAAVRAAAERCGGALQTFLFGDDGQPRRSTLLVVGQRQVSWDGDEVLQEGDCITILPPIAGGSLP